MSKSDDFAEKAKKNLEEHNRKLDRAGIPSGIKTKPKGKNIDIFRSGTAIAFSGVAAKANREDTQRGR